VTPRRLAALALVAGLAAVLLSPLACSQSSEDPRPRCETVLGYWTPLGSSVQLLLPVSVVLGVVAARRARVSRGRGSAGASTGRC
jgi:hypothetical protein